MLGVLSGPDGRPMSEPRCARPLCGFLELIFAFVSYFAYPLLASFSMLCTRQ
jgi:hypothetical protein